MLAFRTLYTSEHLEHYKESIYLLYCLMDLYARTPLDLREEVETHYKLICPMTGQEIMGDGEEFEWSWDGFTMFTQEEIDSFPNQDYIKTLKKEKVK